MPRSPEFQYAYGGTITFDSFLSLNAKNKLIEQFSKVLSRCLDHEGSEYYLCVAKEYHKVLGEDDLEAPHLHFILYATRSIIKERYMGIQKLFRDRCGRSQFYKMTTMKTKEYADYILKDAERLYQLTGLPHYYEMNLEKEWPTTYWDDIDNTDYLEEY